MSAYDYDKFITPDNITLYANTNEEYICGKVRGIVVELPGLGGGSCLGGSMSLGSYNTEYAQDFGKNGILAAYMFPGPWSWGNKGAVRYTDAVVDAVAKKYELTDDFPLVVCGGSMGGSGALMYAADSTHQLSGVAVACPVIDVLGRFSEGPETPRTLISAAIMYDMPIEAAIKAFSPAENIERLQNVPYFISSDGEDQLLPEMMCDEYVEQLKARGIRVEYRPQQGLKHGEFLPEVRQETHDFIKKQIIG